IELPTATAFSKADVCLNDTVFLGLSSRSSTAIDYLWHVDSDPLLSSRALNIISANSNSGGPFSISWIDTGKHFIYVRAMAEHGCTGLPAADTVDVHPLPDASCMVTMPGGTLCLEDSVLFTAGNGDYRNLYTWAPDHFFSNTGKPSA